MREEAILEVHNLSKKMGQITVVNDISFQVKRGEIKGLLGPNGSGKTTILKMLVGLLKPTRGTILINQKDIQKEFEQAIVKVGAVIESPELYEYLTGYDNLQLFFRMSPNVPKNRIDEVIMLLGMSSYIHEKVKTYSLGMLQRLGLAQALLHCPALLLLDEPTNGLDPAGIQDLRAHLHKIAEEGTSIVISSHLLSEIEQICNSILIIDNGHLVSDRKMDEFKDNNHTKQRFFFKVLEENQLQEVLSKHPAFPSDFELKLEKDGFSARFTSEEVADMNSYLVANGQRVIGIEKYGSSLEDVFLSSLSQTTSRSRYKRTAERS